MHLPTFDLITFVQSIGYIGLFLVVFAESGLFFGFFLPGDSLLFTAGLLASQGLFDINLLLIGIFLSAVLGDSFGYAFGRRVGPHIFNKEDSWLFKRSHLDRTSVFFDKHGGRAVILARFLPIVRTFTPILAGVGSMRYKKFLAYNIIGGLLWVLGLTLLGYFLGTYVPGVDQYLIPIVLAIIFISFLPTIFSYFKSKR